MEDQSTLLSIGRLAAASGLSPKALRLYDESALLSPRRTDPFTGYRFYGPEQIGRARLIARLRGIGMGLDRIRAVCDLPGPAAAGEIRAWWLQEQADAHSRGDAVRDILASFPRTPQGDTMTCTDDPRRTADPQRLAIATVTDRGSVRPTQQDAVLVVKEEGRTLLAIADGFGDESIAQQCLDALAEAFVPAAAAPEARVSEALKGAWRAAENVIRERAPRSSGTTLTAAVVHGDRLHIAHIGDTRVLLVRAGASPAGIEVVTQDHTHVRSLVAAGRLTAAEAADHPDRAVLNRALAASAPMSPDLLVRRIGPGDRIALVTDGVHAVLDAESLGDALLDHSADARRTAETIAQATLAAGAPDNLAVVIADVG